MHPGSRRPASAAPGPCCCDRTSRSTCNTRVRLCLICTQARGGRRPLPQARGAIAALDRRVVLCSAKIERKIKREPRLAAAGIRCPKPVLLRMHVLVMTFMGKDGWAAPRLRDAGLSEEKLQVSRNHTRTHVHF